MMRNRLLILSLLIGFSSMAQTGEDYLRKINANYSKLNSLEVVLDYTLYKGFNGTSVVEKYENTVHVSESGSHRKVYTDEIVLTEEMTLVLDHERKTILLQKPEAQKSTQMIDQDIEERIKNCENLHVEKKESFTEINLEFEEHSTIPYSRITLVIDESFWIQSMVIYYANQMNFSQSTFSPEMDYPRLEIDYSNLKKRWEDKNGLTDVTRYIEEKDGHYQPTSLYSGYAILDTRN